MRMDLVRQEAKDFLKLSNQLPDPPNCGGALFFALRFDITKILDVYRKLYDKHVPNIDWVFG